MTTDHAQKRIRIVSDEISDEGEGELTRDEVISKIR